MLLCVCHGNACRHAREQHSTGNLASGAKQRTGVISGVFEAPKRRRQTASNGMQNSGRLFNGLDFQHHGGRAEHFLAQAGIFNKCLGVDLEQTRCRTFAIGQWFE
ncbi:hypothetical protein D3C84_1033570 [compost metagenome]